MTEWQVGLDFLLGLIMMLTVQLAKKWPMFDLAAVRFLSVIVLTVGSGYLLGWLYGLIGTEITSQELFIQCVIAGLSALGINVGRKTIGQIKTKSGSLT